MKERFDRFNLAARLEKFGNELMTLCEQHRAIENRIDVCNQVGAVCRIVMTLKALRTEDRRGADDAELAGSAVRKYSAEFAATPRATNTGSAAAAASDPFIAATTDPFVDPVDE